MSKQKIKQELLENQAHQAAARLGAWVLAGLSVVGVSKMILEHQHSVNPAIGHSIISAADLETMARGEGRSETARLPEEFDVGLQTPHISGL